MSDELRLLRDRVAELEKQVDAMGNEEPGSDRIELGKTVSEGSYPTSAQRFYAVELYKLSGTETENAVGTLTDLNARIRAYNHGSAVPPVTTQVVVKQHNGRWSFRYNG
jgi:hypothetical protein